MLCYYRWLLPGTCSIMVGCLNGKLTAPSLPLDYYFLVLLIKLTDTMNNVIGQTKSGKLIESKQIWALLIPGAQLCLQWAPLHVPCKPGCRQPFLCLLQRFTSHVLVSCVKTLWLWAADGGAPSVYITFLQHLVPSWKCRHHLSMRLIWSQGCSFILSFSHVCFWRCLSSPGFPRHCCTV